MHLECILPLNILLAEAFRVSSKPLTPTRLSESNAQLRTGRFIWPNG